MKSKGNKRNRREAGAAAPKSREILGIILLAVGLFLALALGSFQLGDGGLMGPLGRFFARLLYSIAGIASYLILAALFVVVARVLLGRRSVARLGEPVGTILGALASGVLLHILFPGYRVHGLAAGGHLGEVLAEVLRAAVSTAGTFLLAVVGLVLAAVAATPLTLAQVGRLLSWVGHNAWTGLCHAWRGIRYAAIEVAGFFGEAIRALLPERDPEADRDEADDHDDLEVDDDGVVAELLDGDDTIPMENPEPVIIELKKKSKKAAEKAGKAEPVIVESSFHKAKQRELDEKEKQADKRDFIPLGDGVYRLPPLSLLQYDETSVEIDKGAMKEMAARLVTTLETYGIKGEVQAIRPGPVVTMYEFQPAPGTRVSKIANLSDDLAMSLEAISVRIVAPIPGKACVGIEVPNKVRETVYLKEIIADDSFQKNKSKLALAIGKDNEGRPVTVDLAKMPHLLVAGTTGAGKSVSVNAMITSLLYNATPEEVRMIMVDPKMLELSVYDNIPHLLLPVVTDPRKANQALRWAVDEMERRYQLMAEAGVKDILSYNRKVVRLLEKEGPDAAADVVAGASVSVDELPDAELAEGSQLELPNKTRERPKKLPFLVVIIDEFADLMMTAAKEVEHSVTRLAQKARACGIHLILATQRPTTEVITGLIKSNIPSRMAFRVTNKTNSIAILEQSGAEALLGQGDMLFSDRGQALRRIHGCLVQDEEIEAVTAYLKTQAKPVYDMDILKPKDEDEDGAGAGGGGDDEDSDNMYDKAVRLVAETRSASISMIQRRLRVGYNRAARMVEKMEQEGVVGPPDHTNKREVLIEAH